MPKEKVEKREERVEKWDDNAQQETYRAYQELFDSLTDAYWVANTMQDKDYIKGLEDFVKGILDQLNKGIIHDRTKEFDDLAGSVNIINTRLEKAKEKIDQIIQDVNVATAVAKGIDTVLNIGIKYFSKI